MLHAEVGILAIYAKYVATPTKSTSCQNLGKRAVAGISKERNKKISMHVYKLLVHKLNKEVTGNFSAQLPCLPSCNYGNGSVSWMVNVIYTTNFFES